MASKRNSRIFLDEANYVDTGNQKHTSSSNRSRRDSHGSLNDESSPAGHDVDEALRCLSAVKDAANVSRVRTANAVSRESRVCENAVPVNSSRATSPADISPPPLGQRPANFGVVFPGIYRSSYPVSTNFAFLQSLHLRTIVSLVKADEADRELEAFTASSGIQQVVVNMKGTKKQAIPPATMASIMHLVLDCRRYPLLVHCNQGKHRTGCVVAVFRKLSGWTLDSVLDEYKAYATPKIRKTDVDYIAAFQSSSLQAVAHQPTQISSVQARNFFRLVIFSTVVVFIWILSGVMMVFPPSHLAHF